MVLREATQDDIPMLVALICTAFEEYRGRLEPPSGAHRETAESIAHYLQQGYAVLALLNDAVHYLDAEGLAEWRKIAVMDRRTVLRLTPTRIRTMGFPQA